MVSHRVEYFKFIEMEDCVMTTPNNKQLPHFQGWSNVPEGYYTKNRLRNEFSLKPYDEIQFDATARLYVNDCWKDFVLYHVDNCIVINKRKVSELPITNQNIAEALYVINKSAKVHRDTKQANYEARRHSVVQASKTKQRKLYDLKELVVLKLLEDKKAKAVGIHRMSGVRFVLIKMNDFTFHLPITNLKGFEELPFLGEINEQITAEKVIKVSINFYESKNLLERYLEM